MAGRYEHVSRPGTSRTWCGLPVFRNPLPTGKRREPCPQCARLERKAEGRKKP